ncbi:MAG: DUF1998 domain-containing protein, partial [Hyphomicrobiaceae bacterium]|nr:DUF1998 domain-containing protein [Hyphomicrobiaceae bacterium]
APDSYLNRAVAAPHVALDSRPIVQRHVNAFLLARFLSSRSGNALTAKIGAFMGCPDAPDAPRPLAAERPVRMFKEWLGRGETEDQTRMAIQRLVRGSVLANRSDLLRASSEAIAEIDTEFVSEWSALREQIKGADVTGAAVAVAVQLKRLCGEYLLGELADRGFLPGHGFPNHVVAFELDRELDFKDSREDVRARRHGGPKRPLDIAIRDYAPGSETVVDGQVFRVGGVTLNWQRPSSEAGVREVQALRWSALCERCGDSWSGTGDFPTFCRTCGEGSLRLDNYLKPAGFLRDRHKSVHANVDTVDFVPAEPTRVSAGKVFWERLPHPEKGRIRVNRSGTVYFHTRGPSGEGYGLCLRCGRMEPMVEGEETCSALREHKPLRARESFLEPCEGNGQPFAIRHGLTLGHEIRTDVFELQPATFPSLGAANAIAIALREAVARHLGVEAAEMGFIVAPSRNELGNQTLSMFLFDRPAGGAGYVTRVADQLRVILPMARQLLECPQRCRHSCSACVLVSDAPEREEELDRFAALDFLDKHLTLPPVLPEEERFVPDADISDRPLGEIDSWLHDFGDARLVMWTNPTDILGLQEWPATGYLRRWTDNGRAVTVCFPRGTAAELDDAQRLFLRDYSVRHGVQVAEADAPEFANGARMFAHTVSGAKTCSWASRDPSLADASPEWGGIHVAPVVRGEPKVDLTAVTVVDHERLTPKPGAQVIPLGASIDGAIDEFGGRVADAIFRTIKKITNRREGDLIAATYRDRYARSPLVLRLLMDTIEALTKRTKVRLKIETAHDRKNSRYSRQLIWSDVEADEALAALVAAYGERKGIDASIEIGHPPHKRTLSLIYSDNTVVQVDLDQGFGWLVYKGGDNGFDPREAPEIQAKRLDLADGKVVRRDEYDSQMVVWHGDDSV